jgi:hypothetical protein
MTDTEFEDHDDLIGGDEFAGSGRNALGQEVDGFAEPEMTAEEYANHTARMVAAALEATRMFGIVEIKSGVGQAHILGRVKREKERIFAEKVVYPVVLALKKDEDSTGFIGKQYLLKGGDNFDDLKYAWVFSFASNNLREAAHKVCDAFRPAIPRREVTEGPLMGPGTPQSGGQKSGRKGAAPVT